MCVCVYVHAVGDQGKPERVLHITLPDIQTQSEKKVFTLKIAASSSAVHDHQSASLHQSLLSAGGLAASGFVGYAAVKRKPRATRGVSRNGGNMLQCLNSLVHHLVC